MYGGCLLQHDFREPDPVGVRPRARRDPPRKGATMGVVPGQKFGALAWDGCHGPRYHDSDAPSPANT